MRTFVIAALLLGAGCDRDELDELRAGPTEELEGLPSSDHGARVQEMAMEDAKRALEEDNRGAFLQQIGRQLEGMEQWVGNMDRDIATGYGASPEVRRAFEAFKVELAKARAEHTQLMQTPEFVEDRSKALYDLTHALLARSREISATRRVQIEGS